MTYWFISYSADGVLAGDCCVNKTDGVMFSRKLLADYLKKELNLENVVIINFIKLSLKEYAEFLK